MSTDLLTPRKIAQRGPSVEVPVPGYDWKRQQRWDENSPVAGKHTSSSVQTFDNSGKPKDSASDSND